MHICQEGAGKGDKKCCLIFAKLFCRYNNFSLHILNVKNLFDHDNQIEREGGERRSHPTHDYHFYLSDFEYLD